MALNAEWNHIGPLCHNPTLSHDTEGEGGGGLQASAPYVHIITFFECLKSNVSRFSVYNEMRAALGARRDWKTDASVHYRGKQASMSERWLAAFGLPHVVKQAAVLVLDYMSCGPLKWK